MENINIYGNIILNKFRLFFWQGISKLKYMII